jgi:secreted Zn-dependent insulinase-like peptidase
MADQIPDNPVQNLPEPTAIPAPLTLNPLPQSKTKEQLRQEAYGLYYSSIYTQLVIYGKSPNLASELAKEAANHIMRAGFPFPQIKVG